MNATALYKCILWGLGAVAAYGQQTVSCPLAGAKNGDTVVLRGEVFPTGHDTFVRPAGCEERVILVYGDDPSLGKSKIPVRRDEAFKRYEEYLKAEYKPAGITDCKECWKYRVTAEFQGRLDITEAAGWKKDQKSGKVTGIEGFGHPLPFTRYRLVIAGISKVEAAERALAPCPSGERPGCRRRSMQGETGDRSSPPRGLRQGPAPPNAPRRLFRGRPVHSKPSIADGYALFPQMDVWSRPDVDR